MLTWLRQKSMLGGKIAAGFHSTFFSERILLTPGRDGQVTHELSGEKIKQRFELPADPSTVVGARAIERT